MGKADQALWESSHKFFDVNDRYLVVIDEPHQRIHDGVFFSAGVNDPALGNGASIEILFRVVGGAHTVIRLDHEGNATFESFEDMTSTDDGSSVSAFNRNRFSSNVPNSLVFSGPTITLDGTPLPEQLLIGGTGGKASGVQGSFFLEWILAPGDHLLRLTNDSGTDSRAQVLLDWSEKQ